MSEGKQRTLTPKQAEAIKKEIHTRAAPEIEAYTKAITDESTASRVHDNVHSHLYLQAKLERSDGLGNAYTDSIINGDGVRQRELAERENASQIRAEAAKNALQKKIDDILRAHGFKITPIPGKNYVKEENDFGNKYVGYTELGKIRLGMIDEFDKTADKQAYKNAAGSLTYAYDTLKNYNHDHNHAANQHHGDTNPNHHLPPKAPTTDTNKGNKR